MTQIVELERIIYGLGKGEYSSEESLILLVKEQEGDAVRWKPVAKGWEYNLWHSIGERGGLAEAEELLVVQGGQAETMKIEDYVALYQKELNQAVPSDKALERFNIELKASLKKSCDDKYVKKIIHQDYNMELTHEDGEFFYYKKTIETVGDFFNVGIDYDGKEHTLRLMFTERAV